MQLVNIFNGRFEAVGFRTELKLYVYKFTTLARYKKLIP